MTQASVQQATHEDLLYGMVAGPVLQSAFIKELELLNPLNTGIDIK